MNGEQHNDQPTKERDDVVRRPDEADEDQLDEAIEETFPASDPISPDSLPGPRRGLAPGLRRAGQQRGHDMPA